MSDREQLAIEIAKDKYEMFRAAQMAVTGRQGVPYEQLSERTRRLQLNQAFPLADALLSSDWLAGVRRQAQQDALTEAASAVRDSIGTHCVCHSPSDWTQGFAVGGVAAADLIDLHARAVADGEETK